MIILEMNCIIVKYYEILLNLIKSKNENFSAPKNPYHKNSMKYRKYNKS